MTNCATEAAQRRVASWILAIRRAGASQALLKRYLVEWSTAIASVGAPDGRLLADREKNLVLAEVIKKAQPTAGELQDMVLKRIATKKSPLEHIIVDECWEQMWTNTNWDSAAGVDARGEHIYLLLGYAFGLRRSNATRDSSGNPHGLKAREVAFQVKGTTEPISAGLEVDLRKALRVEPSEDVADDDTRISQVEGVRFRFLTGKPTRAAGAHYI